MLDFQYESNFGKHNYYHYNMNSLFHLNKLYQHIHINRQMLIKEKNTKTYRHIDLKDNKVLGCYHILYLEFYK